MTVINNLKTKEFDIVEFVKETGERYTVLLSDADGNPISGFIPTNLCVTKGVIEATNPDGSVWIRRAPIAARNWIVGGNGGIGMHILETIHCYCAASRGEDIAWVGYGHYPQAGEEFQMPAFAHPQRLFLCKGNMKQLNDTTHSPLHLWTIDPGDTPKFVAQTDCILMRLVGLPSVDDVQGFLIDNPDSSEDGGGI